jgi:anaerobic selenocysteine-containing dehydrogenase
MNISRRDFIKLITGSAIVAAGIGLGVELEPRLLRKTETLKLASQEEVKIVKFTCVPNCTENCWLQAYVYDNRVRYIMTSPDYSEPEYTRGCLRGLSQIFLWYGPDRLRKPLVREPFLKWCRNELS